MSPISYAPHGAPTSMTLGNDLVEATTYNNRLQPTLMNAGSGMLKLTFGYGSASVNNGNVITQQIEAPGTPTALNATQAYAYDAFNRLESVVEGSAWTRSYYYDRYGNRAMQGDTPTPAIAPLCALSTDPTCDSSTTAKTPAYTASSNRLTSAWADYDTAGNMLAFKDPIGSGTRDWSAFYDAENKQRFYCGGTTSACDSSNADAEYVYDGEGNRVQKLTTGETTTYVYDAFGRLAAEYSTAGPSGTAGSYFRTTDHLGSTRLVTDGSGDVYDRRDFFPFGEKILASSTYSNRHFVTGYNASDPASAHLFTAKERDDESGLDYFGARYMGSSLGRFTSPDAPFADQHAVDPQSWNLYAYVRNNPLVFVDPTGRVLTIADGGDLADGQSDLCQILGTGDCGQRFQYDQNTGVVNVDLTGIDLTQNEGANLISDLTTSSDTYNLSYGNTVDTAGGAQPLQFVANLTNTADFRYQNGKPPTSLPPAGTDAQVAFNFGNISSTTSLTNLAPPPRYTTVFHELAEAFATVGGGQQYIVKGNPLLGAHATALNRELTLHGQRPALQGANLGGGSNRPGGPAAVNWTRIRTKPPY